MLRALLLAPPGAGKGTHGERLAERHGVPHLATGDILRRHALEGTPLGIEARVFMDRGELVPDRLVVDLVVHRLLGPDALPGFVLDGFPRTVAQAEAAYRWARPNDRTFHAVISLRVPKDELVDRLVERGRRSGRSDDTVITIGHRLDVYEESTLPLFEFYRGRDILVEVDGTGTVPEVATRIDSALAAIHVAPSKP